MRFAALGGSNVSDYAAAGKAVADSGAKTFAVQRKTGPDYGKLSQVAMKTAAEEKITSIQAASKVTEAGIKAYGDNVKQGNKIAVFNNEQDIKAKQKFAGGIAAIGKMVGAGFLAKDNEKGREAPKADYQGLLDEHNSIRDGIKDRHQGERDEHGVYVAPTYTPPSTPSTPSTPDTPAQPAEPAKKSLPSSTPNLTGSYDGTFKSVYAMAENSGAQFPALVAAQWQLESGGGKAISGKNNFFGMKAGANEAGTSKATWEEDSSGNAYNTSARFKNYETPQASVDELITRWHKDYKGYTGVNNAGSRGDAARMLSSEGYATDSNYAQKLIRIMAENGYS